MIYARLICLYVSGTIYLLAIWFDKETPLIPLALMDWIASDDILGQAYDWVCRQRQHHAEDSDVWQLRWRWDTIRRARVFCLTAAVRWRLSPRSSGRPLSASNTSSGREMNAVQRVCQGTKRELGEVWNSAVDLGQGLE